MDDRVNYFEADAMDLFEAMSKTDVPTAEAMAQFSQIAAVSISISLKRIADALTYQAAGDRNLFDEIRSIRDNTEPRAR